MGTYKKKSIQSCNSPYYKYNEREALTPDEIVTVLNNCKDPKLSIAINLSFACTLCIGEILRL